MTIPKSSTTLPHIDNDLQHRFPPRHIADARATLRVLPVLAGLPVFWMLYDQNSSVWTLQAKRMNLHGVFEPDQCGAINPVLIMILIPLFDLVLYPRARRYGVDISHLPRMCVGMFLLAVAFVVSAALERALDTHDAHTVSVAWIVPQYLVLSVAEIFVSVTGLEFAYSYSPTSVKATIMALFLLTVAVGDLCTGIFYALWPIRSPDDQVWALNLFASMMCLNLVLFYVVVVRRWGGEDESGGGGPPPRVFSQARSNDQISSTIV